MLGNVHAPLKAKDATADLAVEPANDDQPVDPNFVTDLERLESIPKGVRVQILEAITGKSFWGEPGLSSEDFVSLFGVDAEYYDSDQYYRRSQRELLRIEIKKRLVEFFNDSKIGPLLIGNRKLFAQTRYTKRGKQFCCVKEQTMGDGAEALESEAVDHTVGKSQKDPRVLSEAHQNRRNNGWDEFWQFINILTRNMNIVGPRPATKSEYEALTPYQKSLRALFNSGVFGVYCFCDPEEYKPRSNQERQDIFTRLLKWKKDAAKITNPAGLIKYYGFLIWTIKENLEGIYVHKANR